MERIAYHHIYEWEQTVWNDILLHFLWGAGDYEPVKYRNLPLSQFSNLESYKSRKKKGMPMDTIVIHMGGIHGKDKRKGFQKLGLWQGNFTWYNGMIEGLRTNITEESMEFEIRRSIFAMGLRVSDVTERCVQWKWILLVSIAATVALSTWRVKRRHRRNEARIATVGPFVVHDAKNFV